MRDLLATTRRLCSLVTEDAQVRVSVYTVDSPQELPA